MEPYGETTSPGSGHDSERVRQRADRLDALSDDALSLLRTVHSDSASTAGWPMEQDGPTAGVLPAAVALLDAVSSVTGAAAGALSGRADELRDQVRRARAIDADTADRLRALGAAPHRDAGPNGRTGDGGGLRGA